MKKLSRYILLPAVVALGVACSADDTGSPDPSEVNQDSEPLSEVVDLTVDTDGECEEVPTECDADVPVADWVIIGACDESVDSVDDLFEELDFECDSSSSSVTSVSFVARGVGSSEATQEVAITYTASVPAECFDAVVAANDDISGATECNDAFANSENVTYTCTGTLSEGCECNVDVSGSEEFDYEVCVTGNVAYFVDDGTTAKLQKLEEE